MIYLLLIMYILRIVCMYVYVCTYACLYVYWYALSSSISLVELFLLKIKLRERERVLELGTSILALDSNIRGIHIHTYKPPSQ